MKRLRISVEGKSYEVEVEILDGEIASPLQRRSGGNSTRMDTQEIPQRLAAKSPPRAVPATGGSRDIVSPLAALVVSIEVAVGDQVEAHQKVITLEAMKMNTIVNATTSGAVAAINVKPGDAVEEGQSLISLT